MIDYGQQNKYIISIPDIDIEPDIAGIPLKNLPLVFGFSFFPIYFNSLSICFLNFVVSGLFAVYCGKKERKGEPPMVNPFLIKVLDSIPFKESIAPNLSIIHASNKKYRGDI
jgi:hypothetical protein